MIKPTMRHENGCIDWLGTILGWAATCLFFSLLLGGCVAQLLTNMQATP